MKKSIAVLCLGWFACGGGATVTDAQIDGVTADGITADGITADGITADGATADGITADGVTADGATADSATADGTTACDPGASPRPNEGNTSETAGTGGCPAGMAAVDTFCVDVYEASLVELDSGGSAVSSWSPYVNPGAARVRALSVAAAVPQGYINGTEAAAACAEAGKRLCSNSEWLRACQGPSTTTYPYGNTRMAGVCNDARSVHPAVEYFGTTDPSIFTMLDNACLNQLPDSLAATGDHAGCVSAEGLVDMMGNLHEWTADPAGTFRGGYYVDTTINGNGCLYVTTAHDTSHWDYSTGFRCCADPL